MISMGSLNKVDEVYGFQNFPNFDFGDIRTCVGPMFSQESIVKISISGVGGPGAHPHKVKDAISAAT